MELQLEDLEAAATEDELAAENAASRTQTVKSFERKRPARKPFPDHLPRERVVMAAPESCPCCGSAKLSKLGEDITETLEVIPPAEPGQVIQTVKGVSEIILPDVARDDGRVAGPHAGRRAPALPSGRSAQPARQDPGRAVTRRCNQPAVNLKIPKLWRQPSRRH